MTSGRMLGEWSGVEGGCGGRLRACRARRSSGAASSGCHAGARHAPRLRAACMRGSHCWPERRRGSSGSPRRANMATQPQPSPPAGPPQPSPRPPAQPQPSPPSPATHLPAACSWRAPRSPLLPGWAPAPPPGQAQKVPAAGACSRSPGPIPGCRSRACRAGRGAAARPSSWPQSSTAPSPGWLRSPSILRVGGRGAGRRSAGSRHKAGSAAAPFAAAALRQRCPALPTGGRAARDGHRAPQPRRQAVRTPGQQPQLQPQQHTPWEAAHLWAWTWT
jgi:hypothetical protein